MFDLSLRQKKHKDDKDDKDAVDSRSFMTNRCSLDVICVRAIRRRMERR